MVDVLAYARRIEHEGADALAELEHDTMISAYDKRQILCLALYSIKYEADRRDARSGRQHRAMGLLRSFLTDDQRAQLRRVRYVIVRGSLGNLYMLWPRTGMVWRVEPGGKSYRRIASYCLHDYAEDDPSFVPLGLPDEGKRSLVPSADRSIGHMLLLLADEPEFRRLANEHVLGGHTMRDAIWSFRLRAERRELGLGEAIAA